MEMKKCKESHDMSNDERMQLVKELCLKNSENIAKVEKDLLAKNICRHVMMDIMANFHLNFVVDLVNYISINTGHDLRDIFKNQIDLLKNNLVFQKVNKKGMH